MPVDAWPGASPRRASHRLASPRNLAARSRASLPLVRASPARRRASSGEALSFGSTGYDTSAVGEIAATAPLDFPQAVASDVETNGRAPVVLRLVLDLGREDRLVADRAELTLSLAGPKFHGGVMRQRAGVELIPHEISQRPRHRTPPGTAQTSTRRSASAV